MRTLLLILFLHSANSFATDLLMIGEHEAFMANTGVARLGSSSAGWYNPAGLATVEDAKVSASGTLFQSNKDEISGAVSGSSSSFQSVPTQVSTVGKYGPYRWAFSVFNTTAYDYSVSAQADLGSGQGTVPTRIKSTGTTLMIGPSAAMVYRENIYIGASLFLQKDDEYANLAVRADRTNGADSAHVLVAQEARLATYTAVPVLGVTYIPKEGTIIGARLIAPSLPLTGDYDQTTQQVGYSVVGGVTTDQGKPDDIVHQSGKTIRPVELTVGGAMPLPNGMRVYGDLGYSFQTSYHPAAAASEMKRDSSANLSAGAEYGPREGKWMAGAFYRQNSRRSVTGEVSSYKGLTAGYMRGSDHIDTGFGLFYNFGSGDVENNSRSTRSFGLILSTSYKF